MGQSSYNFNNAGSGGTNYWKIGAGGILQPDVVTYPSIVAVSMSFGQFEIYIDDTNVFLKAHDTGKTAVIQISNPENIHVSVSDSTVGTAAIQITNDPAVLATVKDLATAETGFAIQRYNSIYYCQDITDDESYVQMSGSDLVINSTPIGGGFSQLELVSQVISGQSEDGAGNGGVFGLNTNSVGLFNTTPANVRAGLLSKPTQVNVGIKDLTSSAESLFVAFPTAASLYVRDPAGNIGEVLQSVASYEALFNGASVWTVQSTGFMQTDEFTAGAGVYGDYSGILEIQDIGGTTYQIPYL